MNVIKSRFVYHLMAIITVVIWGTTFVSTKILIQHGLSPSDIFFYRFTLAYLCMWCISYKKLFANRVKMNCYFYWPDYVEELFISLLKIRLSASH